MRHSDFNHSMPISDGQLKILANADFLISNEEAARWKSIVNESTFGCYFDYRSLESCDNQRLHEEVVAAGKYVRSVCELINDSYDREIELEFATQHQLALARVTERRLGGIQLPVVPIFDLPVSDLIWQSASILPYYKLTERLRIAIKDHGLNPEELLMRTFVASRQDLVCLRGVDYDERGAIHRPITELDCPGISTRIADSVLWADSIGHERTTMYAPKAFLNGKMVIALYSKHMMTKMRDEIWSFNNPDDKRAAVVGLVKATI